MTPPVCQWSESSCSVSRWRKSRSGVRDGSRDALGNTSSTRPKVCHHGSPATLFNCIYLPSASQKSVERT
ncbi:unnamed protein product [Tetraodon nigroviridis]|uniref:(spotted green pufferfish) hypothetical protein n=1 Tax=Tetraodon nigroviridis TaxID=99883 RepID=Q4RX99_TETNG|nr:unnamed protein product [Tetraodon nigroviridis]